jgi:hypothetical protein
LDGSVFGRGHQSLVPGRKVLISPIVVDRPDWEGKRLPVLLTQERVKNSPDISMNEELSAHDEVRYYNYYGLPYYWTGDEIWGPVTLPRNLIAEDDDFLVDGDAWTIRYIVNDTHNWLPGKKILVAPHWIATVDWKNSNVYVNLSREAIKSGPEFNSDKLDRDYETQLYKHYGQQNYW